MVPHRRCAILLCAQVELRHQGASEIFTTWFAPLGSDFHAIGNCQMWFVLRGRAWHDRSQTAVFLRSTRVGILCHTFIAGEGCAEKEVQELLLSLRICTCAIGTPVIKLTMYVLLLSNHMHNPRGTSFTLPYTTSMHLHNNPRIHVNLHISSTYHS